MSALLALALATAPAAGAIEAERAFSAMAQSDGQWTAFRGYAADDAIMFVPRETNAQEWLAGREDPPFAVMWWPAASFVSCDGETTVNTGPWVRSGSRTGYFTTVWQRREDGSWRWLLDHGDGLGMPRAAGEGPTVRQAACPREPLPVPMIAQPDDAVDFGYRMSADTTLRWQWLVREDGSRRFELFLYGGTGFEQVLVDDIGAGG